jgi:hypothetical protein
VLFEKVIKSGPADKSKSCADLPDGHFRIPQQTPGLCHFDVSYGIGNGTAPFFSEDPVQLAE